MSKRKKNREKRSVAKSTARRRERAASGLSDLFVLPEGTKLFSIDGAGVKRLDIIPYTVGAGNPNADKGDFYWERTFYVHRGIGVNDEWVICPARTEKKKCPICEYIAKLNQDPEADEAAIKSIQPSRRMIVNVVDLKKAPNDVQVWHVSHAYFGDAMDKALQANYEDEDDNMDNFCDPEGGYYVKCVVEKGWQGKGFSVERVDFKARKDDLDEDILDKAVCLDDILAIKSYDELKDILFAGVDDDEDEEKEESKKKKTKKAKKKKRKDEDEDEDGDEDDGDEDDGSFDDEVGDDDDDGDDNWEDEGDGDEDEDGDEDDGDEDEEEVEHKKKRKKTKKTKKRTKKAKKKNRREEDNDDGDEDDGDEDDDDDW